MKQSKVCCEALELAFEISKLINFSPKRSALFSTLKAQITDEDDIREEFVHSVQLDEQCVEIQ